MKSIIILFLFLLLPMSVIASTTDFVANADMNVSDITFSSGTTSLIIFSGSASESSAFSNSSLSVTNPNSTFKVGSSDASVISIQISQSSTVVECASNSAPGTSYVTLPTGSGTYTVSPSSSSCPTSLCSAVSNVSTYNSYPTCGAASCASGYNLSGSGSGAVCLPPGGGGITSSYASCGAGYSLSGSLCVPVNKTTPNQTLIPSSAQTFSINFKNDLFQGVQSEEVRNLQIFLSKDKTLYPEGQVSGYFGALTKKAIERFQIRYAIAKLGDSGYGRVGPSTRGKINEMMGLPTSLPNPRSSFNSNLSLGARSPEVSVLQKSLALDKDIYPEGLVSGYFGARTREAVERFQIKHLIAKQGDSGFGMVGPKTRLKLQEVFGR